MTLLLFPDASPRPEQCEQQRSESTAASPSSSSEFRLYPNIDAAAAALEGQCANLLQQQEQAPARAEAMRRKEELQRQFDAAVTAKADYLEIAEIGIAQLEHEKESAQLPLSEEDYLTLESRHAALVLTVRDLCQFLVSEQRFATLKALSKTLSLLCGKRRYIL